MNKSTLTLEIQNSAAMLAVATKAKDSRKELEHWGAIKILIALTSLYYSARPEDLRALAASYYSEILGNNQKHDWQSMVDRFQNGNATGAATPAAHDLNGTV